MIASLGALLLRCRPASKRGARLTSRVRLGDVVKVDYGPRSVTFLSRAADAQRHLPWLCFSLSTNKRSYDFVCGSAEETLLWVLGLQHLCLPADARRSKGRLLFCRAAMRVRHAATQQNKSVEAALADCFRAQPK